MVLVLAAAVSLAGCHPERVFQCGNDDSRCGGGGRCVEGACAFPDDGCGGARLRWIEESSAGQAGECVGQPVPDARADAAGTGRDGGSFGAPGDSGGGADGGGACGGLEGYFQRGAGCYRSEIAFTLVTWVEAESDCADDGPGTHLVIINDADEQFALENIAFGANIWIGLSDRRAESDFRWVTPTGMGFSHWSGGQPDSGFGDEDCGGMDFAGYWHDVDCDAVSGFVCELDGVAPDPARF